MGLIKATFGSAGGVLADMWKEYFTCDAISKDILVKKGVKNTSKRSSNTKGSDNYITNGSGIVVADGQCVVITEKGKVVELCAEPGEYTFDSESSPSIFTGKLGKGILDSFKMFGKRFTYGGEAAVDQRVYYFNTKEIIDNKFGTANPIPFRVVDKNIGLDIDVSVRCSGVYSYKIDDPILFYTNVCGNIDDEYSREEIDSQLKTEFISALQPSFAALSDIGIRPNQIVAHNTDLEKALNEQLDEKWKSLRGLEVVSVAIGSLTLPDEDMELIKKSQHAGMLRDVNMAAATLTDAQADAMRSAAENEGGAFGGFVGLGMAMNAGGANPTSLFQMGQNNQQQNSFANGVNSNGNSSWNCECGTSNTGNFCVECGKPKPQIVKWICPACNTDNTGKFCTNCGQPRPEVIVCKSCGWKSDGKSSAPKFCPECGKPISE